MRSGFVAAVAATALFAAGCGSTTAAPPSASVTAATTVQELAATQPPLDIDDPSAVVTFSNGTRVLPPPTSASPSPVATSNPSVPGTPEPVTPQEVTSAPVPPEPVAPPVEPAPSGTFTLALAGDVNFAERTADLLANPAEAFGEAKGALAGADLTMLNLETAITENGEKQNKQFTFRAPASAFTALEAAGVDVVSMANNHAADYGNAGLADTFVAMTNTPVAVVGAGPDAAAAYAPFRRTVNGVPVAVFAATAYRDMTFRQFSAEDGKAGVANAFSPRLVEGVRAAAAAGETVVVYLHWGTEYTACPDDDQQTLAAELAAAGASAVVGTHAHQLQGAGWRSDGVYVAYGLGNYLWWRSFDNEQDDNGVLTLTFTGNRVTGADFAPSRLDDRGIPVPAQDPVRAEILTEWAELRGCTDLADVPPA